MLSILKVRISAVLAAVLTVVALSISGWSQASTYLTPSNRTGTVPFGSYIGSDFENVDLPSGGLNLNIPIYGRKGRGIDQIFVLRYSSKFWGLEFLQQIPGTGFYEYVWSPDLPPVFVPVIMRVPAGGTA
jgi:hypothetical protein